MIDKRLLVDTVSIQFVGDTDEWGSRVKQSMIQLDNVRLDRRRHFMGTRNNRSAENRGTLFIYPKYNADIIVDDSWLHAIVDDGQRQYEVVGYNVCYHPFKQEVFSYEVEVV